MPLCIEKQHDFLNSIQAMKGYILKATKDKKRWDLLDRDILFMYLGKMEKCSKLIGIKNGTSMVD